MPFDLARKNVVVTDIVSKTCQHGTVAEGCGPHAGRLGKIDGHMGGDAHAAAVPDEHDLAAAVVGRMAEVTDLHEGGVERNATAAGCGAFRFTGRFEQGVEIRTKPVW